MKRGYKDSIGSLSEAVDTAITLFHAVWVPRKIVMNDSLKTLLQVDTFREAVGTNQYMAVFLCQGVDLHLAFLISQTTGNHTHNYLFELFVACELVCDVFANILCCLDILAEYDRVHATVKRELHNIKSLFHLFITISFLDVFQLLDEAVELFLVCSAGCF